MRSETDLCILRTGQLFEADLLCSTLDDEGIPYYRRLETSGGMEYAMPASPAPGPGVWFTVWISGSEQNRVEKILEHLRVEPKQDPGVWDSRPTPGGRKLLYGWFVVVLVFILFSTLRNCGAAIDRLIG
ncbi:MAG: hypothetical protein ABR524_10585 [Thermoanaerobaculia bacterium]